MQKNRNYVELDLVISFLFGHFQYNSTNFLKILLQAYASIVKAFNWKNFAIIYEDIDDLVHLQGLVGEHQMKPSFIARLSNEMTDYRSVTQC